MSYYNMDAQRDMIFDSIFGIKTNIQKKYEIRDDAVYYCEYRLDENNANPVKLKEEIYLRRNVLEAAMKKWGLIGGEKR